MTMTRLRMKIAGLQNNSSVTLLLQLWQRVFLFVSLYLLIIMFYDHESILMCDFSDIIQPQIRLNCFNSTIYLTSMCIEIITSGKSNINRNGNRKDCSKSRKPGDFRSQSQ